MKRVGHLYERICDPENIQLAIRKASQGKRQREYVKRILGDPNRYAGMIREMLLSKSYVPSPYSIKTVLDGPTRKERTIFKPRFFPDQIIHWALMLQLQSVILRGMYEYTCGSVPGRGTSYAQKAVRRWLDGDYKGTKYCLKMDIRKFYPSVDLELLKGMLRRVVKDADCLWLIDAILDSTPQTGLPIGNYTSQWLSNFFLQGLDHYIKEDLKARYYVRYVDDLVILGGNKKALHTMRLAIDAYLRDLHLTMKPNWQVFLVNARAIDFLGFRFYRDHTTLRKANALRIRRRLTKVARKGALSHADACAVISYWGWLKHSDSYRFYHQHVKPKVSLARARKRVRQNARSA